MYNTRLSSLSNCLVFFDFDNTITHYDILDDIIQNFSVDREWVKFEKSWKNGEIGSGACLKGQLRSVRATKQELFSYLSKIKIDPHFHNILEMLKREGLKPVILSDSFRPVIKYILENNGVKGVQIYANELKFSKNKLIPSFPHRNPQCSKCAHCKKKNLLKKDLRDKIIMNIGDGLSDICPAECSDFVFAKSAGSLLKHFRKTKRLCLSFNDLFDIYNYFRGLEK